MIINTCKVLGFETKLQENHQFEMEQPKLGKFHYYLIILIGKLRNFLDSIMGNLLRV